MAVRPIAPQGQAPKSTAKSGQQRIAIAESSFDSIHFCRATRVLALMRASFSGTFLSDGCAAQASLYSALS
ncbi:MAG: hypothetical protein EB069_11060 [Actinobacteria bacterium]|nr:hypothetical protein [Actinomycetota bacterium]